ncbi:MAG TPA: DNA polymerase III subunit alpha [Patescibacteria group bacterium]|nr:DNA polymerase III subunit alpha [Patescibacteria group bacterium]
MRFTHLHTHSHYSLLDGLSKIDELLDRAKALGMDALALTDHGSLYGAVEFAMKAKEKGIKPIIGCEVYVASGGLANKNNTPLDRKRNHLTLLAKNVTGYRNLMQLITIAHLDGYYYKPRVDHDALRAHSEGLIALSGCLQGEVPEAIAGGDMEKAEEIALLYRDIFGAENYFFELQDHPHFDKQQIANKGLKELAKKIGVPLVATGDTHYIHKDDAPIQDILLCIQTNRKVFEKDRMNLTDFDLSLRTPEEMIAAFKDVPEAIENTQRIADMCTFELKVGEIQLPSFPLPTGKTADDYLRELCEEGLVRRFGADSTPLHRERMDYELSVIQKTGYASYFLIVQDFVNWAKDKGIVVGPGRGSAAGSFVSYLTNITNIDPIRYQLLFERFLNPERVSMPDIDMDFADDRRDEVLEYVREKYGRDHVAQIITFGTMAARAAIRDAGRALGMPYDFCDRAAKLIPMFSSIEEALADVEEFKALYAQDPAAKKLIDSARRLEGVARHASVHACGVVITPKPVVEYTPLQRIVGNENGVVTQYSSSTKSSFVEKIGLLKMDFLGLKNLTIIQNTLRIVERTRGINIDIDRIPLDDAKAYELLQKGHTTGVFQLESSGMKRYLKQLKPTVFEDIIAMVALYRPGPMDWIPDFIAKKHGQKKLHYLHPKLKPILKDTYGVAVYQEQVMRIAQDLAGFTLGEADLLRKAMGKKIMALIKQQREKFAEGCVRNSISKPIAQKVFDFIEPFAGYGFNRSHAACYALIGYQTAFLKANYPAEFMAALMTSDQDNIDRIAIEAHECVDMGIPVLPPNVNESFRDFAVIAVDGTPSIRFGLRAIKNVGRTVASEIVEERKRNGAYATLAELLDRVHGKDLNKKSLEALAMVGALDTLGERNQIIQSMERIISFIKNAHHAKTTRQDMLFSDAILAKPTVHLTDVPAAGTQQRLQWEKELLGLYVSDHPVAPYESYLARATTPISSITKEHGGKTVRIGGVVTTVQKVFLKNKKTMLFVTIEDRRGRIEALIFPTVLERTQPLWIENRVILAEGKISDKDGALKILIDTAKELTDADVMQFQRVEATKKKFHTSQEKEGNARPQRITIALSPAAPQTIIENLSALLGRCDAGDARVRIRQGGMTMETSFVIDPLSDLIAIERIPGVLSVEKS